MATARDLFFKIYNSVLHNCAEFVIILLITKMKGRSAIMEILSKICVKAARVYRTLNRPLIRSKVNADFDLYPDEYADRSVISVKIKDFPEVRLLDLILAIAALKLVCSAIKGFFGIFKN